MSRTDIINYIKHTMISYGVDTGLTWTIAYMAESNGDAMELLNRWMLDIKEPKLQFQCERVMEDLIKGYK